MHRHIRAFLLPGLLLVLAIAAPLAAHTVEELHLYPGELRPDPARPGEAIALFEIHAGKGPDVLVSARSDAARAVQIVGRDGKPARQLRIRGEKDLALRPRGPHLRLVGLSQPLPPGTAVNLVLTFAEAGALVTTVTVPKR